MKYGMTFVIDLFDVELEEELHVLTMPGDYIRMCNWADEALADVKSTETVESIRRNYATAWFALKRRGKLKGLGLPEELDVAALDAIADRFTVFVEEVEDGALPLAMERAR